MGIRGWPRSIPEGRKRQFAPPSSPTTVFASNQSLKNAMVEKWYHLLNFTYRHKHLTKQDDKLPAVEGLGTRLGRTIRSRYLDGHFEHQIIPSLLWQISYGGSNISRDIGPSPAPSWSWASGGKAAFVYPEWFKGLPIAQYHGSSSSVSTPSDADNTHSRPSNRTQLRVRGFKWQFVDTSGSAVIRASIWRRKRSSHIDYTALLTFSTLGDQTKYHQRSVSVKQETADNSGDDSIVTNLAQPQPVMKVVLEFDRPSYFEPKIRHYSRHDVRLDSETDITTMLMETPPTFLLFLIVTPGANEHMLKPGLGGLILGKVGDAEDGPVCERLGTFRAGVLDQQFGVSGEVLAEQIKCMDQSTVYLI